MKSLEKLPEQGIDELEKLAYLIAEEFARETKLRLAGQLLEDPALRSAGKSTIVETPPQFKVAGAQG